MADIYRPRLRLRPSEQRFILLLGDLIASAGAMLIALYIWYQFSLAREVERLIERGFREERAVSFAASIIDLKIPFWFYLLPLVWLLLMVNSMSLMLPPIGGKPCVGLRWRPSSVCWDIR